MSYIVDPRNPDIIVASSYQRRRHVWVLINGGPGSGIHKSTDRGKTWTEVKAGLPGDHMGKIGLAGAPSAPDTMYAIIEANDDEKGVYRSTDFGSNWTKQSSYMTTSPQYYNELVRRSAQSGSTLCAQHVHDEIGGRRQDLCAAVG